MNLILRILSLLTITSVISITPQDQLTNQLNQLMISKKFKGIQIQINKNAQTIYYHNKGIKNQRNQPIDNNTIFRIASCSKSFSAIAIMQLVQKGKLKLNDSISNILGYQVKHPYYPNIPITVEMILSHQSSIAEPQIQYDKFLQDIDSSIDGSTIPSLKEILVPGGKYYNPSIFPEERRPGQYFNYSNLGFIIIGTIIQILSQQRFDIYLQENVLNQISQGLTENATYDISTIRNYKNLGTIYEGEQGKWVPSCDNHNGPVPTPNLTKYKIGTNGGVFAPQGGIRASVFHMSNYLYIYQNKGVTKNGKRIISQKSVNEILRPRYQYHGAGSGNLIQFHLYGLGIYTTSYLYSDIIIEHEVVRGHLGSAYGLISGYHYWGDYILSYIVNGVLDGYVFTDDCYYEQERKDLFRLVDEYMKNKEIILNNEQQLD